ncbi:hypothetical protein KW805_04065 [Candidatus Pacearchaeota archaeon]|nr:hypothetical protein [Candidatus Pacearchaeota archaeon]
MKSSLSKTEAKKAVDSFFKKESFIADEVRKIRRLAMKYNIKLGSYRKSFCKKCLYQLKGSIRVTKHNKTVICQNCGYANKYKI